MANNFGYSGNLGYNSYRVSRSGKCCCPPKGDKGDHGLDGLKGDKGDRGQKGFKGNTGSIPKSSERGLFIYDSGIMINTNNFTLDLSLNVTDTNNFGANNNDLLSTPLSSTSLISFKNLKFDNLVNGGIAEFYGIGPLNPNNSFTPLNTVMDASEVAIITCDLSCNSPIGVSLPLIVLDNRNLPLTNKSYNYSFGPVSCKVSSLAQNNVMHFDNEYILRLRNQLPNQVELTDDFKLMVKFHPL